MATSFDRQIMLDMFLTNTTFAMEAVGMGALGLAGFEVIGAWGYLLGLAGILGGVGWGISRVILNPDKVVEESIQKRKDRERKEREEKLDSFDEELTETKDWEVRKSFREIRTIYEEFWRLYPDMMEALKDELERQFLELFEINRKTLEGAHESLLSVRQMQVDRIKKPFMDRRTRALKKVADSTEKMTTFVAGIAESAEGNDEAAMEQIHDSLRANLEIMREVESEMSEFMTSRVHE